MTSKLAIAPSTILATALLTLAVTGCSWVSPTPSAADIRILDADRIKHCQRLGSASASSLAKVGFINRSRDKLQRELNTLARNEAVKLGGNAVVAESPIEKGQQHFGVYRCP